MPRIGSPFNSDRKIVDGVSYVRQVNQKSEVVAMTSLARSAIYKYIQLSNSPRRKEDSSRGSVAESEVQEWIASGSLLRVS